jgi:hypothetical protein
MYHTEIKVSQGAENTASVTLLDANNNTKCDKGKLNKNTPTIQVDLELLKCNPIS